MKHKLTLLISILILLLGAAAPATAALTPVDVKFTKHGDGQFIYCNNPEFLSADDLSTDENPNPVYMMKQEGLNPGKYSVFFCFYNWTDFDIEPDIEFVSENAEITINSIGYYIPRGWDYWDCLGAWSDYLGMNIRTVDGLSQYVPYKNINLPQTFKLKNSAEWINKYIYNYDAVSPKVTFNMLVDFTIESGTADVNFAALKSYDVLGDRSHHSPKAKQAPYKNDTSIKGIEKESLPIVESELNVEITTKNLNGDNIPVKVYNQYFPEGNTYDYWMTNINPSRDGYEYSKECSTGSDMLEFELKDDSKLRYYGTGVSQTNRDNIWHFDIYHHNTTAYEAGCPSKSASAHIPNSPLPDKLDIKNPPDLNYEFNLGNFGVTNRYHLNVTNSDTMQRSINYYINASLSSCIVAVRDKDGTLLNPYTLEPEDAFALSKGINWTKKTDYMFSAMLKPGEKKEFILDVTLPTNCYGGIVNGLVADKVLLCEPEELVDFPQKDELYPYETNMWFDGYQSMRWEDGELYIYNKTWTKIDLPQKTREVFANRTKDIRFTKTSTGYIARFSGYDQYGNHISEPDEENNLYILDNSFGYIKTITMPSYISDSVYADGITYIMADKLYESSNGISFTESDAESMPVSNGQSVIEKLSGDWYIKYNGEKKYTKLNFEYPDNADIMASDGVYYIIRSLKNYDTDLNTGNFLAVSTDGINYRDMWLPNRQLRFIRVDSVGSDIFAVGRNEVVRRDSFEFSNGVTIKTPEGYFSLNYTLEDFDESFCINIKYLESVFGLTINEYENKDGTIRITAQKDDEEVSLITGTNAVYNGDKSSFTIIAPYISGGTVYVPFKDFMEALGYSVEYDKINMIVDVQ